MRVSRLLSAAFCAGAVALAGTALAEEESAASPEAGETLFSENCAACHNGAVAPGAADLGKDDAETFDEKMKGHPPVGALEGLSAEDVANIYAYLQSEAEA